MRLWLAVLWSMSLPAIAADGDICEQIPESIDNEVVYKAMLANSSFPLNYYAGPDYSCEKVLKMQTGVVGIEVIGAYGDWFALRIANRGIDRVWIKKSELILESKTTHVGNSLPAPPVSKQLMQSLAQAKAEEERRKKELAEKKRKEAERKMKVLAEKKRKENAKKKKASAIARASTRYSLEHASAIQAMAEKHWQRPENTVDGLKTTMLIAVDPSGKIKNVDITNSSGNVDFDHNAVTAVGKISPLPELGFKAMRLSIGPLLDNEALLAELQHLKNLSIEAFRIKQNGKLFLQLAYFSDIDRANNYYVDLKKKGLLVNKELIQRRPFTDFSFTFYLPSSVATLLQKTELKEKPEPFSESLASLSRGARVIILDEQTIWAHVRVHGQAGYVFSEFLGKRQKENPYFGKANEKEHKQEADTRRKQETALQAKIEGERIAGEAATALGLAVGRIAAAVDSNWMQPQISTLGLEAIVRVNVRPTGEVMSARVVRSSGNSLFDRSTEIAVFKASPLPIPTDPRYYPHLKEFDFRFKPK